MSFCVPRSKECVFFATSVRFSTQSMHKPVPATSFALKIHADGSWRPRAKQLTARVVHSLCRKTRFLPA